jgi:DNA/RNA endonuclease G (NUC1)
MKKLILFLLISIGLNAQFNYQAIVKDSNGNVLTNSQVKFKFTLMEVTSTSTPVYVEEHTVTTPADGVVNLTIGGGTASSGVFSDIDWSLAVFVKEELDLGSGYEDMGTRQFASVPVAEYAKRIAGLNTISSTITLDSNISSFNTTGVVSATSFRGNADQTTLTYSGTVTNVLAVISDLKSQIEQLNTISEGNLSGIANIKTYKGRAFQTNIVTETSIFTVSYNEVYEQPNWIEYQVRELNVTVERSGDFYGVDGIYTSHEDDYHNNDWDKGHLAPAASFLDSQENLEATFSYLNCALMKDNLNRYEWAQLEQQVRDWAAELAVDIDVRVDLFFDDNHTVLNTGAHVPSRFLKTITLPSGTTFPNETISKKCFEFPNADTNGADWTDFEVVCSLTSISNTSTTTLIAYESFDYDAGTPLYGYDGGYGWYDPWDNTYDDQSWFSDSNKHYVINSNSNYGGVYTSSRRSDMTYEGIQSVGNYLGNDDQQTDVACYSFRVLQNSISSGIHYVQFIVQFNNFSDSDASGAANNHFILKNGEDEKLVVRRKDGNIFLAKSKTSSLEADIVDTGVALKGSSEAQFIILQINHTDSITKIWVDPILNDFNYISPPTADAYLDYIFDFNTILLVSQTKWDFGVPTLFDEIRVMKIE